MNIKVKNTPMYTLDLTEMEIAILIHALGKTKKLDYETLCLEYSDSIDMAQSFDTVAQNMYSNMRSVLSNTLNVDNSLDEIYTRVVEHSK